MERLSGKLTLRPTRIGFLLRPSDKRSLRRILELCTCLWGGTYNPLIPVSPVSPKAWRRDHYGQVTGRELAQGYLRFFEPDVYVEAQAGLAAECGIEDDSRFGIEQRVVQLDDFVTERDGRGPQFVFGQSIFDLYRDLYRKDFQFQSRHPRQVLLFDGRSAEMLFFAAAAGLFPQEESLAFIREGYIDAFDAHVVQASGAAWMGAFNDGSILPFSFTRRGIERRRDHSGGPTIFVLDASSSIDVIDFWNFRQFKSDVLPVSMSWLAAQRDFLRDLVTRNYRPLPGNRHGVMINTTVEFARSIDPESAENVAKEVFGGLEKGSWTLKLWYDPIWEADTDDTVARPSRADLEVKSVDLDLHVGNDESAVRFQSLAPDFAERFSGGSAR